VVDAYPVGLVAGHLHDRTLPARALEKNANGLIRADSKDGDITTNMSLPRKIQMQHDSVGIRGCLNCCGWGRC
jgi:hypothetical protein